MARRNRIPVKRKRLSYREMQHKIKQDPLVEWLGKATNFVKQYSQILLAGVLVFVLVLVGVKLFFNYQAKQEMDANRLLYRVQNHIAKSEWDQAATAVNELLTNFSSTNPADIGRILKPSIKCSKGNYDEAIQDYQDLISSYQGDVANELKFGLAGAYQSKNDFENALTIYEELEKASFPRKNELAYKKGLTLEGMKRIDDAKKSYESIDSKSETMFYGLARERMEWLRSNPA